MATYLIDYENVKSEGIKGITQLSEEDTVVIFYSHNADTITFEAMDMIFSSKAQVRKYKILCGGKNALDFQLSTYLGYLIHEGGDSYFYIISKDNGFKHVVDFWKRTFKYEGYVFCFPTIGDGNARQQRFKNATAKERQVAMEQELVAMSEELKAQEALNTTVDSEAEETAGEEPGTETSVAEVPVAEETAPEEYAVEETSEETAEEEAADEASGVDALVAETSVAEQAVAEDPAVVAYAAEVSPEADAAAQDSGAEKAVEEVHVKAAPVFETMAHQPVQVTPPAELPESVRRELKKADEAYAAAESKENLQAKIQSAVAIGDMSVKVVDTGVTVHQAVQEEQPQTPVEQPAAEEAAEPVKENRPRRSRRGSGRSRNNAAANHEGEEKKQEKAVEEQPAAEKKTGEKKQPAKQQPSKQQKKAGQTEKQQGEEKQPAEKQPEMKTEKKPAKKKQQAAQTALTQTSAEEGAPVPEKRSGRGRRPKVQKHTAAEFEKEA